MKKYDEDIPEEHGWKEHRNLWPQDIQLRNHGFQILARPRKGPVLWSKDGAVFTQQQALNSFSQVTVTSNQGTTL